MNRVSLTKEEAAWFTRNVVKTTQLLEAAAKKDPKILERSTYKTLASILPAVVTATVAVEAKLPTVDVQLTRKQRIVVRELILSVNKTLTERVIPEYERRGDSHKDYLDKALVKADTLEKMARKFR